MPRLALTLALLALAAACDTATDPAIPSESGVPAFAAGGKVVDPAALTPAPSQIGATADCRADGQWIICHTALTIESVNLPVFDVACGTIYETSRDDRLGIRWYNAADSVIVKRHVRQDLEGTWSLSPDGAAPTVDIAVHGNWYDSQYADPNDLDSGVRSAHGEFTVSAPGFGVIAHIAGLDDPEAIHHGAIRGLDEPAVVAELCAALTR